MRIRNELGVGVPNLSVVTGDPRTTSGAPVTDAAGIVSLSCPTETKEIKVFSDGKLVHTVSVADMLRGVTNEIMLTNAPRE